MRGVILFLALCAPGTLMAATVVRFGARLCDSGQQLSNGQCIDKVQNECPAGYYETIIPSSTYSAQTLKNQCMNAYDKKPLPPTFHPIYSGILVKFGPTLCGPDKQFAAGACQAKEQGRCPDGFYKTHIGQSTFSPPSVGDQECMNAYNSYELPEYFTPIYNGILVSFGPKLCGAGQYLSDGTCMPIERGECPENFHNISTSDTTLSTPADGACASGYSSYWLNADCNNGKSQNNMCAVLCEKGLTYTGAGTCATICSHGMTQMRAGNGMAWPLYSERQTTPALNIKMANGVCYINFLPGAAHGVMNIKAGKSTYHISD